VLEHRVLDPAGEVRGDLLAMPLAVLLDGGVLVEELSAARAAEERKAADGVRGCARADFKCVVAELLNAL
jgi:hypothetical protein